MKMSFFDDFIADFTEDDLKLLSKNQLLKIAIVNQDVDTIKSILSIPNDKVIIRKSMLMYLMKINIFHQMNDIIKLILTYPYLEYDQIDIDYEIINIITFFQDVQLYDIYYNNYVVRKFYFNQNIFHNNINKTEILSHLVKNNRLIDHITLTNISLSIEKHTNLEKIGLMYSCYDELFDEQGKPKLPVNNLFIRCCADGRIDDIKKIISSHKIKK